MLVKLLSKKTKISITHVENILKLLNEGSTIPFISRYCKELTGGASDEQLREFETIYAYSKKLLERKEEIKRLIGERAELNKDLESRIDHASTLQELEDIFRPYKEKKNTRAAAAIAAGLEPLADMLVSGRFEIKEFQEKVKAFVKGPIELVNDAIKGAQDILQNATAMIRVSANTGENRS